MDIRCIICSKLSVFGLSTKDYKLIREIEARFNRMRKNKKLDKFSDEYLVEYILRTFYISKSKKECKYYVNDTPLSDYARQNGVLPTSIRSAIAKGIKRNPNSSVEDLANSFVERSKNRIRYTYDGYSLASICKMHMFSNIDVLRVFHETYPNSSNMTQEEVDAAIKDIVDAFIEKEKRAKKAKGLKYEL